MAQLPPKVPSFPPQKMPATLSNFTPTNSQSSPQQPFWAEEFLDFSLAWRVSHRRSASDSIAFMETSGTLFEECGRNSGNAVPATSGFDRLDDEQLKSMFNDDGAIYLLPTAASSHPSTPSDQNSNNDEKTMGIDPQRELKPKSEPGEVESSCKPELSAPATPSADLGNFHIADPKGVKR